MDGTMTLAVAIDIDDTRLSANGLPDHGNPTPAYKLVADAIERLILQGSLKTGDVLPAETALAAQFGVNRSTVREGIRSLEQNGLVRREGGKKLFASRPRHADTAAQVSRAMLLHDVTFLNLWETIAALEPVAAALATERATEQEIAALEDNLARTQRSLTNRESLTELDIEFHHLVAVAAHNPALLLSREPLSHLFYPAFYQVMDRLNARERLLSAHTHIVQSIRNRDMQQARIWMDKHIVDFRRGYELADLDIHALVDRDLLAPRSA
ncbi:FadR family transcriptional regulator [Pigmentiphaga aceris]|uniref:FadR family transcriptional regulator n=2 Tax=Pigmentiphaga aceris TaxID=1940612 RepID=A0A5C0AXU0_9BURK|nr:FadR family transcriptional regulator [Pigmentiphaga aceris]